MSEEHFGYSYRELNWKYVAGNPFENNHSDWRYRYNAMGEREQKRLYHAPLADSIAGQPYPWVYYLLGGSKDQLAVWHGQQMTSPFCDTVRRRNVFLYPTEYLTYGVGKQSNLITKPDGSKEYRFFDHLGSSRAVLSSSGFTFSDYAPFGGLLGGGTESRKGFIDKEKDVESSLRNHGVRLFDDNTGRFLSVDALWEQYPFLTPYQYGANNPLILIDQDGMKIDFGGNSDLESAFLDALAYADVNKSESAKTLRHLYESEDFTIRLIEVERSTLDEFDRPPNLYGMPVIYWAPLSGFEYSVKVDNKEVVQRQSPTTCLVDEANHAIRYIQDERKSYLDGTPSSDPVYQTKSERYSIEAAYDFAKAAGEVEHIRQDHTSGQAFQVASPTSNVPIQQKSKEKKK